MSERVCDLDQCLSEKLHGGDSTDYNETHRMTYCDMLVS